MAGNLRILDVEEVKTVPHAPLSHPFVERLIGTIGPECVDRTLFWTAADLGRKLVDFQRYYREHRAHSGWPDERRNQCQKSRVPARTLVRTVGGRIVVVVSH